MTAAGQPSRSAGPSREAVIEVNRATAAALEEQWRGLGSAIADAISAPMTELPGGTTALEGLHRLAHSHVEALRAMLLGPQRLDAIHGSPDTGPHAREMVHAGVGIETVLQIYQLGHQRFWGWWTARLHDHVADGELRAAAVEHASELMFAYTHAVTTDAIRAYADEQSTWMRSVASRKRDLVEAIIEGHATAGTAELSASLGYDLALHHVGVVVWADGDVGVGAGSEAVDAAIRACAVRLGAGRPLVIRTGVVAGWGWIGLTETPREDVATSLVALPHVRIAVGTPAGGPEGFGATHREALAAQERAVEDAMPGRVVHFADIEVASLFRRDEEPVARFLSRHLGDLAADTARARELRDTLRAYLDEGEYAQATADRLYLHRNTLARRLDAAARLRGRPLTERRLELAVALELLRARDSAPPPGGG